MDKKKAKEKERGELHTQGLGQTSETNHSSLTNSISHSKENVNTKIQDKEIGD